VVLVVAPLLLHRWLTTGSAGISRRDATLFTAGIVLVNAPWYVAVWIARPEFGAYFFIKHNVLRFVAPFDHLEPIWYYAPVLLGGLLPATLLGWGFARWLLSGDPESARARTPALGFCLLAGGWCVLFFSLSGSKLPTYILPAFGPLALARGYYWSVRMPAQHAHAKPWAWHTTRVFIGWGALLLIVNAIGLPWYAEQRSPMGAPATVLQELCADPATAVCCYPRSCDSAAFYLGRDDFRPTRSKFVHLLIADLLSRERTVVLFTHNHSLAALKHSLPPDLRVTREVSFRRRLPGPALLTTLIGETPWGLCDVAVIECSRPTNQHP
jgi:4-amino-4-deoxy-L-arabinose transferase-like glycosyltransferase